jgi:hypothetical protein
LLYGSVLFFVSLLFPFYRVKSLLGVIYGGYRGSSVACYLVIIDSRSIIALETITSASLGGIEPRVAFSIQIIADAITLFFSFIVSFVKYFPG